MLIAYMNIHTHLHTRACTHVHINEANRPELDITNDHQYQVPSTF